MNTRTFSKNKRLTSLIILLMLAFLYYNAAYSSPLHNDELQRAEMIRGELTPQTGNTIRAGRAGRDGLSEAM